MCKRKTRGVVINDNFFHLAEVKHTEDKYKGKGLTMIVYLFYQLPDCKNAIGKFANISHIASRMGVKKHTLVDMIKNSEAFHYDEQRNLFWAPRIRKKCGLQIDPSDEELQDIADNGNVFFGYVKKKQDECEDAYEEEAEEINDYDSAEINDYEAAEIDDYEAAEIDDYDAAEIDDSDDAEAEQNEEQTQVIFKSSSSHLANQNTQNPDNQAEDVFTYRYRNRNISNINRNKIASYRADGKQVSPCPADDDDKDFKENLFLRQREIYVTEHTDANMQDDNPPCSLPEAADECVPEGKKTNGAAALREKMTEKRRAQLIQKEKCAACENKVAVRRQCPRRAAPCLHPVYAGAECHAFTRANAP